jgi:hypothetical protein
MLPHLVAGVRREELLHLRDGVTTEADALLSVEKGGLPDHALYAARAAEALVHGDLAKALVAVLRLERLKGLALARDLLGERLLQGLRGGAA